MNHYPKMVDAQEVRTPCYTATADQDQYESIEPGDIPPRQDYTAQAEMFHYSRDLSLHPPAEDHGGFDRREEWSFGSEDVLGNVLRGSDSQYMNDSGRTGSGLIERGTNLGSWAGPLSLPSMDPSAHPAPYGTPFRNHNQLFFGAHEADSHAGDLMRDDQDMFFGANDTSAYVPNNSPRGESNGQGGLEQPSSNGLYPPAFMQFDSDNRQYISYYAPPTDMNTNRDTIQAFHQTTHPTHTGIPSISLSEGPWSSETLRGQNDHKPSLGSGLEMLGHRITRSMAVTTDTCSGNDSNSMFDDDAGLSASSLDSTNYEMMDSQHTFQATEYPLNDWQWTNERLVQHVPDPPHPVSPIVAEAGPASHMIVEDENLPGGNVSSQLPASALETHVYHSNREYLPVPGLDDQQSEQLSEGSMTSASVPDILVCDNCGTQFRGIYRKGNLARHARLKHKGETETVYVCEECPNERTFKRKDARLKHYRKHHPYLNKEPARSRRSSCISKTSDSSFAICMD
ncbi:hypothetical protein NX059_006901 [Plenodomus lindquistii]|nr:hypothetical protein NX059_006901 [Plenodomus lindquistii]